MDIICLDFVACPVFRILYDKHEPKTGTVQHDVDNR